MLLLLMGSASEGTLNDKKAIGKNKILEAADNKFFVLERPLGDFMGLGYKYKDKDTLMFE